MSGDTCVQHLVQKLSAYHSCNGCHGALEKCHSLIASSFPTFSGITKSSVTWKGKDKSNSSVELARMLSSRLNTKQTNGFPVTKNMTVQVKVHKSEPINWFSTERCHTLTHNDNRTLVTHIILENS